MDDEVSFCKSDRAVANVVYGVPVARKVGRVKVVELAKNVLTDYRI